MECDSNYIYFIQSVPNLSVNYLIVYDWDGNFIKMVQLSIYGESENIFTDGNVFYIGVNGKNDVKNIYKVKLGN